MNPRVPLFAGALVSGIALAAAPAMAQPVTTITAEAIAAVDSSLEAEALAAILKGGIADHAQALADLDARSISIPELEYRGQGAHQPRVRFLDIALEGVEDGVVASLAIGRMEVEDAEGVAGSFGPFTISNLDLGAVLALSQMLPDASGTPLALFSAADFGAATLTTPEVKCSNEGLQLGRLVVPAIDWQAVEGDDQRTQEALRTFFSGLEFDGLETRGSACKGMSEGEEGLAFTLAAFSMDAITPGLWPETLLTGFDMQVETQGDIGRVAFGTMTFGSIDYAHVLEAAARGLEDSFENARRFVPHFSGFSITDIRAEIPDSGAYGRMRVAIDGFSLDFDGWLNGLPTGIVVELRDQTLELALADSMVQSPEMESLTRLIVETPMSYRGALRWDRESRTIALDSFHYQWGDLAAFTLSATLTGASDTLFSYEESAQLLSLLALGVGPMQLEFTDSGLIERMAEFEALTGEADTTPAQLRSQLAKQLVEELVSDETTPEMAAIAATIARFFQGGGTLTLSAVPADGASVSIHSFMASEAEPERLFDLFEIEARLVSGSGALD
ncbi:hypothetical protein [Pelagibacterium lacus]|nr:hypothetical protein [Pelagibacterium lacus]